MEPERIEQPASEETDEVTFEDGTVPSKRKLSVKGKAAAKKICTCCPSGIHNEDLNAEIYGKLLSFLKSFDGWTKAGDSQEEAAFVDFVADMWKVNDSRLEVCQRAVVSHGLTVKTLKKYRMNLLAVLAAVFNKDLNTKTMNRTSLTKAITSSASWKRLTKDDSGAADDDDTEKGGEGDDDVKDGDMLLNEKELIKEEDKGSENMNIDVTETIESLIPKSISIEKPAQEATLADITDLENEIVNSLSGSVNVAEVKERESRERMQTARKEVAVLLHRLKEVDVTYRIAKREVDEWNLRLNRKKSNVDGRLQEVKDKAAECRTSWQQYQELGERLKTVPMSQDELQKWQQLCADCLSASKKYSTLWEELMELKRGLMKE